MPRAWRADYDNSVDEVRKSFRSTARQLTELSGKFAIYNPKNDQEQLAAYVLHARASLSTAERALEKYADQWDLHLTQGGYERQIRGEWSDTP